MHNNIIEFQISSRILLSSNRNNNIQNRVISKMFERRRFRTELQRDERVRQKLKAQRFLWV
jgi:hypothetical protein